MPRTPKQEHEIERYSHYLNNLIGSMTLNEIKDTLHGFMLKAVCIALKIDDVPDEALVFDRRLEEEIIRPELSREEFIADVNRRLRKAADEVARLALEPVEDAKPAE